jgi:hypothetical protein
LGLGRDLIPAYLKIDSMLQNVIQFLWIHVVLGRDLWRALLNMTMYHGVP